MKEFQASCEINAPPEVIWRILTDAAKYPEWDPGIINIEGTIVLGNQLTLYTKADPKRAFKPTVIDFKPSREMTWRSGMPLGLFHGARTFLLEPLSDRVRFTLREEYGGLLLPMIGKSIPDLNPIFAAFCAALKKRAESA
jgi:hypothetical protein